MNLLRKLRLNRIDLVDKGANPGAEVVLFKREGEHMSDKDKTVEELQAEIAKQKADAEAQATKVAELTKRAEDAEAKAAEAGDPSEVEKKLTDLEKRAKDAEAEAKKDREEVAKLKEDAERRDYIAKAGEFEAVMGSAGEFGPLYRKIHKALKEDEREKFDERLRSAQELVKNSAAWGEIGAGGEVAGGGDAWAKIEKMAEDLVSKGDGKIDKPTAITRVLATDEGSKLYTAYLKEQEKR